MVSGKTIRPGTSDCSGLHTNLLLAFCLTSSSLARQPNGQRVSARTVGGARHAYSFCSFASRGARGGGCARGARGHLPACSYSTVSGTHTHSCHHPPAAGTLGAAHVSVSETDQPTSRLLEPFPFGQMELFRQSSGRAHQLSGSHTSRLACASLDALGLLSLGLAPRLTLARECTPTAIGRRLHAAGPAAGPHAAEF